MIFTNNVSLSNEDTPPVVQLSPSPSITTASDIFDRGSSLVSNEPEKTVAVQPPSPICVILDDDSIPSPPIDKKVVRQPSPTKRTHESDNSSSKQSKRSRDSDKSHSKEKSSETSDAKRKRANDGKSCFVIF